MKDTLQRLFIFLANYTHYFIIAFLSSISDFIPASNYTTKIIGLLSMISELLIKKDFIKSKILFPISGLYYFIAYLTCLLYLNIGYLQQPSIIIILTMTLLFSFLLLTKRINFFWLLIFIVLIDVLNFKMENYKAHLALMIVTLAIYTSGIYKRDYYSLARKKAVILSFFSILILLNLLSFYSSTHPEYWEKIKSQKEIRAIYLNKKSDPLGRILKNTQVFFIAESCNEENLFFGTHSKGPIPNEGGGGGGLFMIKKNSKGIASYHKDTSDNFIMDCKNNLFYIGHHRGSMIYGFDQDYIKEPVKIIRISGDYPTRLTAGMNGDLIFVTTEEDSAHILDLKKSSEVFWEPNCGSFCVPYIDRVLFSYNKDVFVTEIDMEKKEIRRLKKFKRPRPGHIADWGIMAVDEKRHHLFLVLFSKGYLSVIDLIDYNEVGRLKLEKGIRFANFNVQKDLLFVVEHVNGGLFIIDPEDMVIKKRLYVGPRARWVSFSNDGQRAFLASSVGGFEIDIDELY